MTISKTSTVYTRLDLLLATQAGVILVTVAAFLTTNPPQAFAPIVQALLVVEVLLFAITLRARLRARGRILDEAGDESEPGVSEVPECRVLLIGLGRSGKTSIIRHVVTGIARVERSTTHFEVYRVARQSDLGGTRYDLVMADYQGQKFSQLVVYPQFDFIGPPGDRRINAIVFVVDLFCEMRDANGDAVADRVLLDRYAKDTEAQIRERVEEQCKYINEYTLESVLEATLNRQQICAVFLVVNKIDLLRALIERGSLPGVRSTDIEALVSRLYGRMIALIREAARVNGIDNLFGAYLISARTGENLATVFAEIQSRYIVRHLSHRVHPYHGAGRTADEQYY